MKKKKSDSTFAQNSEGSYHSPLMGKLLIAMPSLKAPDFDHSVIYICQHDKDGAMGLIVNHPIKGLNLGQMLGEMGISLQEGAKASQGVFHGGPLQSDRGFVLHSLDYYLEDITLPLSVFSEDEIEIQIPKGLGLTASRDILIDIAAHKGPDKSLISLGYAGWGSGQLENEIRDNCWLVVASHSELIFAPNPAHIWCDALKTLGISPAHLSPDAGQA
jgi:putative transcriptional regulator